MNPDDTYDLAGQVIGCAMTVHRTLGPGFLESVYENALALELQHSEITFERQQELSVSYRDQKVGHFKADLVVEGALIVELKSVRELNTQHEVQLVNYLTATGIETGLLLNFGAPSLQFKKKFLKYHPPKLQN